MQRRVQNCSSTCDVAHLLLYWEQKAELSGKIPASNPSTLAQRGWCVYAHVTLTLDVQNLRRRHGRPAVIVS